MGGDNHDTLGRCYHEFVFKPYRVLFNTKKKSPYMLGYLLSFVGSGSLQEVDFEVHGTETESMSGHKSTDWEIVIKRKEK